MATRYRPEDDSEDNHEHRFDNAGGDNGGFGSFFSPSNGEPPESGGLLAAFEAPAEADGDGDPEPIQLECIDLRWAASEDARELYFGFPPLRPYPRVPRPKLFVLELKRQPTWIERGPPGAVSWYAVRYDLCDARDADGRIYSSLFSAGTPVRVRGERAEGRERMSVEGIQTLARRLNDACSLFIPIPYTLLSQAKSAGVAVYDVGQGAWQAVLDKGTLEPFVYIDCGGGVLFNRKTFPPDFECPPLVRDIILSHWDWDHWSSAHRFTQLLGARWYTPPVAAKPIQIEVALQIAWFGSLNVLEIPAGRAVDAGCLTIERCTGNTENDRGFAVTVQSRRGERARRCLLPGDAAYRYIPSVFGGQTYHALSMSHHGGRLHSNHYPVPKARAVAANSAGPGNTYKHPLFRTLSEHKANGWPMPVQTGTSGSRPCHVLLPWGKKPQLFHGSSALTGPSLEI